MEAKESGSSAANLGSLPPKILVKIFRRMSFANRIRMSAVCRHWNWLIFEHFGDRIVLHLEDGYFARNVTRGDLCGDRKYANIRLIGASVEDLLHVHERRLEALWNHVRDLHLVVLCLNVDLLTELLRKFINLQTLILFVKKFESEGSVGLVREGTLPNIRIVEGKSMFPSVQTLSLDLVGSKSRAGLVAFLKIFRQRNLPAVRHITMTCIGENCDFRRNPTWLTWLNEFAPVLHTLEVDFIHSFMMAKFFALSFSNLKSLTLRMFVLSPILFPSLSPFWPEYGALQLEHFEQFLSRMVSLNSLQIALKDVHFGEVADAIYSMDQLHQLDIELVCKPNLPNPLQLEDIWYMKNLRKLIITCDHIEFPPVATVKPMPLVKDLTLEKVKRVDWSTLRAIFPHVKMLDVHKCPTVSLAEITWPSLETLSIKLDQVDTTALLHVRLQKLKVLRVFSENGLMDRLHDMLGIATLEQLHLDGVWKGSLALRANWSGKLYLNGAACFT